MLAPLCPASVLERVHRRLAHRFTRARHTPSPRCLAHPPLVVGPPPLARIRHSVVPPTYSRRRVPPLPQVKMLRGQAVHDYCAAHLTPQQLEFINITLKLPPRPGSLPALTTALVPEGDPTAGLRFGSNS